MQSALSSSQQPQKKGRRFRESTSVTRGVESPHHSIFGDLLMLSAMNRKEIDSDTGARSCLALEWMDLSLANVPSANYKWSDNF